MTFVRELDKAVYQVQHKLLDPAEEKLWVLEAEIDLREPGSEEGSLLRLNRIGT